MASPRVLASSSAGAAAANSDVARQSPAYRGATVAEASGLGPLSAGALLRGFYGRGQAFAGPEAPVPLPRAPSGRTAEDVWEEMSGGAGPAYDAADGGEVTLEDFLMRTGAVREEDVGLPVQTGFVVDPATLPVENPLLGFGSRTVGGGGRVRKRAVVDDPVDKVALRRQKRMIKNRESAARSRERKQAYTVELESLVARLEEENAVLLSEQEEHHAMMFQQLMENIIPITEERKPPHSLRRTRSMLW